MAAKSTLSTSLKLISFKLPSSITPSFSFSTFHSLSKNKREKPKNNNKNNKNKTSISAITSNSKFKSAALEVVKRRTRSEKEFDEDYLKKYGDKETHIPVMIGEVLDVFDSFRLQSFVDCTLGAAGHSCAIIQAHPELQTYIGLDVDPVAHEKAQFRISNMLNSMLSSSNINMKPHMILRNFKEIKQAIGQVEDKLLLSGVDGILMDLGMSSMQVDDAGRGFSMLNNGPLDMRMDPKVYGRVF